MSQEGARPVRVLVVEENRIFGDAISAAITDECTDLRVVGTALSAGEALNLLDSVQADVVLLGKGAEQTDIDVVDEVLALHPSIALVLFGFADTTAQEAKGGSRVGVAPKSATVDELCDAIRAVVTDPPRA